MIFSVAKDSGAAVLMALAGIVGVAVMTTGTFEPNSIPRSLEFVPLDELDCINIDELPPTKILACFEEPDGPIAVIFTATGATGWFPVCSKVLLTVPSDLVAVMLTITGGGTSGTDLLRDAADSTTWASDTVVRVVSAEGSEVALKSPPKMSKKLLATVTSVADTVAAGGIAVTGDVVVVRRRRVTLGIASVALTAMNAIVKF